MLSRIGILCFLVTMLGCSATSPNKHSTPNQSSEELLKQLVYLLPTQDTVATIITQRAILDYGEAGIIKICRMLTSETDQDKVKAQYAIAGLAAYVTRPGLHYQRIQFIQAIHKALKLNMNTSSKAFLISQLQLSGNETSIPVLGQYLSDQVLCQPVCQALVKINSPAAGKVLQSQLSKANRSCKIAIIKTLGELLYETAADEIIEYAKDEDMAIRATALYALANMGYPPAGPLLKHAIDTDNLYLKNKASTLYVLWINNLENKQQSVSLYREIITHKDGLYSNNLRISVLNNLVEILGQEAIEDIIECVKTEEKKMRATTLDFATKVGGKEVTQRWIELLKNSPPELQAEIIDMLARRGEVSALPDILDFLKSPKIAVRLSAINACYYLGGSSAVPHLIKCLAQCADPKEQTILKEVFLRLPNESFIESISEILNDLPEMAKITVMEILSERHIYQSVKSVIEQLKSDSHEIRIVALKALKILAQPVHYEIILSHLITCDSLDEKVASQDVIIQVALQISKPEERINPIVRKYQSASLENKRYLMGTIKRLHSQMGLEFVLKETAQSDPEVRDLAIRTIVDWPSTDAIEALISLAQDEEDGTYNILALRGCIRLLRENNLGSYRELEIYEKLLNIAERKEEKLSVLAGIASLRNVESLKIVSKYISDRQLGNEAIQMSLNIAHPSDNDSYNLKSEEVALALIESWTNTDIELPGQEEQNLNQPPEDFIALFNGKDLNGWKGLVEDPIRRAQMSPAELEEAQARSDKNMREHWGVTDGVLHFDGQGNSLCTTKDYSNFELLVDWKIEKDGDSGIYLRGSPQVQIWDPGFNRVGSGGLFNNTIGPNEPLKKADNPIGEWNTFRIIMIGPRVTVYLNGILVVDNVDMENYWERDKPIYSSGAIELQAHHSPLYFRNIFIKELPDTVFLFEEALFNGRNLNGWQVVRGEEGSWKTENDILYSEGVGGGWLSTTREFNDFQLELEFRLPADGNSGIFIRAPHEGDPAYTGMEIQLLDDYAQKYAHLKPWQYTGSIYGVVAPVQRVSKKANQWQKMKIICSGPKVQVHLNGEQIIDTNLINHMAKTKEHPGLKRRKGYIGLQNHGYPVWFRNIKIKLL